MYPVIVVEVEGVRCPALLTSVMVSNRDGDFQLTVEVTRVEKASSTRTRESTVMGDYRAALTSMA